jgi:hypothetical protein
MKPMDHVSQVHGCVDLLYEIFFRKIIQKFLKIARALYFYKTPLNFPKIIF